MTQNVTIIYYNKAFKLYTNTKQLMTTGTECIKIIRHCTNDDYFNIKQ